MSDKLQSGPFCWGVGLTFTAVSSKPSETSGAPVDLSYWTLLPDPVSCTIYLAWAQSVLPVPPLLQVGDVWTELFPD